MAKTTTKKSSKSTKAKSKTAKVAKAKTSPAGARRKHDREVLMGQVVELRDGGMGWADIAGEVGADAGLCRLLFMTAKVKPKDRIKGTDDEITDAVIEARQENQSWGLIAARANLPESKVRGLYRAAGHDDKEGYAVVQRRAAEKPAKAPTKKTKKAGQNSSMKETSKVNKSKREAVKSTRKAKKGTANPSKG